MICKEIIGNISSYSAVKDKKVEHLSIEWYEATKRIMRKKTPTGIEVAIKFLKEGQRLREGDIVYEDDTTLVAIDILPCDAIQVAPKTLLEMGTICYEIGNKHLPLFIQEDKVLVPYEKPLERLLIASGYTVDKVNCKLLNMLKANVEAHSHGGSTLFSKILDLTT